MNENPGECLELGIVKASRVLNHKLGRSPEWVRKRNSIGREKNCTGPVSGRSTFRHVAELSAAVVLLSSTFPELKLGRFIAFPLVVAVKESRPSDATLDL